MRARQRRRVTGAYSLAIIGGLVAIVGVYWDDAWHTDRGRDTFFIAPHLVLYGGIAVAAAVVGDWLLRARRDARANSASRDAPLALAMAGVVFTLAAAPLDDLWHRLFGRDAVLWSPPHLLGVASTLAIAVGLRCEIVRTQLSRWLADAAGVLVLAALVVPVMEYESDVPQFTPALYLPVLGAGLAAAILILRPANDASWALTRAATGYTVLRVAVVALLAVLGFSTPIIPPILIAAVASDALLNARWRVWIVGPLIAVLLQLTYAPYLRLAPHGITITGDDLITSTIATTAVVTAILGCGEIERRGVRRIVAATGTIGITLLVLAPPAFAHDPGQGTPRGNARLQVRFDGDDATFRARIMPQDCDELHPRDTIARRAGVARHRALTEQAQCSFTSRLRLPSKGRWFLYARFFDRGKAVEAWIPVDRGEGASARRELYEPPAPTTGAGKVALGVALYGIGLTVLLASIRVARVTNQSSSVRTRSGAPQCRP